MMKNRACVKAGRSGCPGSHRFASWFAKEYATGAVAYIRVINPTPVTILTWLECFNKSKPVRCARAGGERGYAGGRPIKCQKEGMCGSNTLTGQAFKETVLSSVFHIEPRAGDEISIGYFTVDPRPWSCVYSLRMLPVCGWSNLRSSFREYLIGLSSLNAQGVRSVDRFTTRAVWLVSREKGAFVVVSQPR
ncbi:hypothetical protein Tco_0232616, partial [Tanacetum coccineum]